MNITTQLVLQHFLAGLLEQLKNSKVHELDGFFNHFFTKKEVIEMLKFTYENDKEMPFDHRKYTKTQLLAFLSNADVLYYFLEQWYKEITQKKAITAIEVIRTLEQLGHQTHYLAFKAIQFWDAYDYSNYESLCKKAGKVKTVYGIYDAHIKAEDVEQVTTHPKRFYESYQKAQDQIKELIACKAFTKDELQILPRLVGNV